MYALLHREYLRAGVTHDQRAPPPRLGDAMCLRSPPRYYYLQVFSSVLSAIALGDVTTTSFARGTLKLYKTAQLLYQTSGRISGCKTAGYPTPPPAPLQSNPMRASSSHHRSPPLSRAHILLLVSKGTTGSSARGAPHIHFHRKQAGIPVFVASRLSTKPRTYQCRSVSHSCGSFG